MPTNTDRLIGVGLYTIPEAAKLTGAAARTIRRWLTGYHYRYQGEERISPAVWTGDVGEIGGQLTLGFLDLMEIRFIKAFRLYGVSWPAIREAAKIACEMYDDRHPFSRHRFRTDGRRIFEEIESRVGIRLFDLNRRSWVFHDIVSPSLYHGLDFDDDQVVRWFPMHPKRSVVIDPEFCFGRPIVARERVPTEVLAAAAKAEESVDAAARWYDVTPHSVRAAVDFEQRAAA